MARATITPVKIANYNEFVDGTSELVALTADGGEVTLNGHDERTLLIVQNTSTSDAVSVTIKAGNGIQGVADLTFSVPKSATTYIVPESGRFKNVSGTDKGKLVITGTTAIKVACVMLP